MKRILTALSKAARAKSILDYAEANGLDISCYQDFGWPAVSIK